ncbi:unnamed protein product [Pleuronectes platessa]|uniref:Uncharacterized protein n=1 Tax=Pleuronectes platessa TaxID=8262 RepID=A0A9N7VD08_PLEPL|nr:unnamed protein product [Pleuronectes platessa]
MAVLKLGVRQAGKGGGVRVLTVPVIHLHSIFFHSIIAEGQAERYFLFSVSPSLSLPISLLSPPPLSPDYPFLLSSSSPPLPPPGNSPDSWPSLSESDPLCLERLRYICWRA